MFKFLAGGVTAVALLAAFPKQIRAAVKTANDWLNEKEVE